RLIYDDELIADIAQISADVKAMISPARQLTVDLKYQSELTSDTAIQHYFYSMLSFNPSRTYLLGVTSYPVAQIEKKEVITKVSEEDREQVNTTEQVINDDPAVRFSAQIAQRWHQIAFRFGLFEGSGGLAVDLFLLSDRLRFSGEAFNFVGESSMRQFARMKLYSTIYLNNHIFASLGLADMTRYAAPNEELWLAVRPFLGGGFQFTDNDIKNVMSAASFAF
ncbi:MAG: hypothetical protein OXC40_03535, partial [Proteobacteria bacterium]|nr:hypothetical protein [Pseudomonadota bacterium]